MWYLAEIILAEPFQPNRPDFQCESCEVVLEASSAEEAYSKALEWGRGYVAEPPEVMQLVGVSRLTEIGDELGDGTEICGRFFESTDVWEPNSELIPPPAQLSAMRWEHGRNVPLEKLLTPEAIAQLKRVWGQPKKRKES